ncbi:MAG: sodium:solute symporter [Bacteroidales bacterium]|nr:sodium:solute symporter [Bacteroidales bacterium]
MSAGLLLSVILGYFILLVVISWLTSKKADNSAFFLGNRKSPWYVVAFGMIGASLSGVTFISVPGWVGNSQFSYMQMVLGYLVGYFVIANVLMPMYYKLNLTSIYTYLESRFGKVSYKTGASFFLISRIIGASFRLFLVASVLQLIVFDAWEIPFFVTVLVTIALIWLYTFRGGIKTIIWTDTLQTFSMLLAVIVSVVLISRQLDLDFKSMIGTIRESEYSRIWFFDDWKSQYHFVKQFLGGVFIAIVMTGLDQDMMQKNLSCRNIKDARKNMYWMSIALVPVNLIFLSLGALLFIYSTRIQIDIPESTDMLFPVIATGGTLGYAVAILFIIGLVAAAYSSADSALTSLTTSFTIDILDGKKMEEVKLKKTRFQVHIFISFILLLVILLFRTINDENVISAIFRVAGYTYGPLLGMYTFGLFHSAKVKDNYVPFITVLSPILTFFINRYSTELLWGYNFGFELLLVNGLITYLGLWMIVKK